MTLQEAERKMARLMKAEKDFVESNPLPHKTDKRGIRRCAATPAQQKEWLRKREILEEDINFFGQQLAANPDFADILIGWIVWVFGRNECDPLMLIQRIPSNTILEGVKKTDALSEAIINFIQENDFHITESGGGPDGWDIGVPCTDKQARKLCDLLYKKFHKAINSGLIIVRKEFNDFFLPKLTNWPELDAWIKRNDEP